MCRSTIIRERIRPLVESRQASEPDLIARRTQQTRDAILQAAALQFARRGYRRTRIADIIREVGVTTTVFSAHFSTKRQLFVESFSVFVRWMSVLIEPPLADEPDPAVAPASCAPTRTGACSGSVPTSCSLAPRRGVSRRTARHACRAGGATLDHQRTGARSRRSSARRGRAAPVSDELMAYSLYGAGGDLHACLVGRRLRAARDPPRAPVPVPGRRRRLHRQVRHGGEAEELRAADRPPRRAGPPIPRPRDASF